jgi:hypothetical protein
MNNSSIFQEFEEIASQMGIMILQEKGNFKGGFCLLEAERIIVINKLKPIEQRIKALSKAFSKLDTSKIYLKPLIRELIEGEQSLHQLNIIK